MTDTKAYQKEYYQKNKAKSKANFKKWYAKPGNKEKMKVYMRELMRKRKGITKEDFRIKD